MSSELTSELSLFKAVPGSGEPFRTSDLNDNSDKIDAAVVADRARLDVVEANGWVTANRIASESVVSGKIAPSSVTSFELAFNSVGSAQLQANAVINGKIAANAVGNAALQTGAVSSSKIQDNAVSSAALQSLSVTSAKLADTLDLSAKSVVVATQAVGNTSSLAASSAFATYAAQDTVQGWVFEGANLPAKFASGSYTAVPSSGLLTVDLTSFGFDSGLSLPVVTANIYQPGTTKFVVGVQSVSYTSLVFKVLTSTGANATVSTRVDWQAVQARA